MRNDSASQQIRTRHNAWRLLMAAVFTGASSLYGLQANAADAAPGTLPAETATVAPSHGLPRVIVLATGGTIAGQAASRAANAYNAGGVAAQQLIQAVPGIEKLAQLTTEQVASIGSQDMNDKIWFKLARRIQQIFNNNEADAVVITHGTDTLEETAFFLDNVLHTDKPVVLVGSMRPSTAISADGPGNLYEAVELAAA